MKKQGIPTSTGGGPDDLFLVGGKKNQKGYYFTQKMKKLKSRKGLATRRGTLTAIQTFLPKLENWG